MPIVIDQINKINFIYFLFYLIKSEKTSKGRLKIYLHVHWKQKIKSFTLLKNPLTYRSKTYVSALNVCEC